MKLSPDGIVELSEFDKPSRQGTGAHTGVAAALGVPVDRRHRVNLRQIEIGLEGMIVNGPQTSHRAVGDVGAMLPGDLLVPLGDEIGLTAEPL